MDDIFHFEWRVDQSGYEIVSAEHLPPGVEAPVLESPPIGGGWNIRRKGGPLKAYRPLEDTYGLARQFASLFSKPQLLEPEVLEPQDVLKFANEFGLLGVGPSEREEHQLWWRTHIQGVRYVVQKIEAGKKQAMAAAFTEYVEPSMTVRIEAPLGKRPSLKVAPLNLISAMWLQIAQEITEKTKFRKCLQCPKWFPHGPGTGHKVTKRFCSARCRKTWHRDQKSKG